MYFHSLELTNALRPALEADESLLFVQDVVGLYEGKHKLPRYQNGHVYLTSHRICYVDDHASKELSVSIVLSDVDRSELQAGFLTSSPKISLYAKPPKRSIPATSPHGQPVRDVQPPTPVATTWICSICSFPNPVPSNFDPSSSTAQTSAPPPCQACGIKPPIATVLKAAIAGATHRSSQPKHLGNNFSTASTSSATGGIVPTSTPPAETTCPRCTFANHASLPACEMCGSPLPLSKLNQPTRADSPSHAFALPVTANGSRVNTPVTAECIKISFRNGGDKVFHSRLRDALIQRKWLLRHAPKLPAQSTSPLSTEGNQPSSAVSRPVVGIAGLERRGRETRDKNTRVIGGAFEDLEALMASAKQIVALAETFGSSSSARTATGSGTGHAPGFSSTSISSGGDEESKEAFAVLSRIGTFTTRDMFGAGGAAEELYLKELSRHLAEYLTAPNPASGASILAREGGIMSLVDAWALFNAARNGVELVSPTDFRRAAELWSTIALSVPVRLRRFKSGVFAIQNAEWNDEAVMAMLCEWLCETTSDESREGPGDDYALAGIDIDIDIEVPKTKPPPEFKYGRGVTAQEAADKFGWSVGIAVEELEMAEEKGVLCREEGIEGLRFWRNWLVLD